MSLTTEEMRAAIIGLAEDLHLAEMDAGAQERFDKSGRVSERDVANVLTALALDCVAMGEKRYGELAERGDILADKIYGDERWTNITKQVRNTFRKNFKDDEEMLEFCLAHKKLYSLKQLKDAWDELIQFDKQTANTVGCLIFQLQVDANEKRAERRLRAEFKDL